MNIIDRLGPVNGGGAFGRRVNSLQLNIDYINDAAYNAAEYAGYHYTDRFSMTHDSRIRVRENETSRLYRLSRFLTKFWWLTCDETDFGMTRDRFFSNLDDLSLEEDIRGLASERFPCSPDKSFVTLASERWGRNPADTYRYELLHPSNARELYNRERFESCMWDNERVYFYEQQEESKMLLVAIYEGDRYAGRTILWTADDGSKIVDRVYPHDSNASRYIKGVAREKGWDFTKHDTYDCKTEKGAVYSITLKDEPLAGMYYPYFDTFFAVSDRYRKDGQDYMVVTNDRKYWEEYEGSDLPGKDGNPMLKAWTRVREPRCEDCGTTWREDNSIVGDYDQEVVMCDKCEANNYIDAHGTRIRKKDSINPILAGWGTDFNPNDILGLPFSCDEMERNYWIDSALDIGYYTASRHSITEERISEREYFSEAHVTNRVRARILSDDIFTIEMEVSDESTNQN